MVLESLLTAQIAERKPLKMLPLSVLYSSIGVLLALWIFPSNYLAVIAFTVIAMIPLMVNIMRLEESKEEISKSLIPLSSHRDIFPFFVYMFVGLTISFAIWFLILPHEAVSQLFSSQISAISGHVAINSIFTKIFINNIRVLAFSIIFSLLYGAGAIFIITWNASLVGVAIANTARSLVAGQSANYFGAFSIGVARYLTHGIP
ncbi:hypothetical protein GF374_01625, partial [Candidatus Woesearchaeota archaeon]|nr:hypothetical protein [Candidatus Woesearchaeota archaeon]